MRRIAGALVAALLALGVPTASAQSPTRQQIVDLQRWDAAFRAKLDKFKAHPKPVPGQPNTGVVVVSFTVARDGRLLNAYVLETSKSGQLDAAALLMLHRASPLPPLPRSIPQPRLSMRVPISFHGGPPPERTAGADRTGAL